MLIGVLELIGSDSESHGGSGFEGKLVILDVVARSEPVIGDGEELVVEETVVHGEHTHHENDVAQLEDELEGGNAFVLWCEEDHGQTDAEEEESMAVITVHHGEKEGESYATEHGWVDFLVCWHVVHVDDELMDEGEVVLLEVSGWNDLLVFIILSLPLVELSGVELREVVLDLGLVLEWGPHKRDVCC